MLALETTIESQYANSPTLLQLIQNMNEYVDPRASFQMFYDFVWNVDTAQGFGLDILGKIVGVTRLLKVPGAGDTFGFNNASSPPDWRPFGQGTFSRGTDGTLSVRLPDNAFRVLVLTKALANIVATNARSINQLLQNLFPGRGRAYVIDLGGMAMQYTFEFSLEVWEFAMLVSALPHPAGVAVSVVVIPTSQFFGFQEAGDAAPFDVGVFFDPGA